MENNRNILIGAITVTAIIFAGGYYFQKPDADVIPSTTTHNEKRTETEPNHTQTENIATAGIHSPINEASSRITKKPFGIKIDPKTSPVQPEKFSGYHTGTDFETTPQEAKQDIKVFALCSGKLLQKRTATGYGGIVVQACNINEQPVTIIYGHIDLKSVSILVGQTINIGEKIAILGDVGTETNGERKHLHLGIHKGPTINIKGYVQSSAELTQWIDYKSLGIN